MLKNFGKQALNQLVVVARHRFLRNKYSFHHDLASIYILVKNQAPLGSFNIRFQHNSTECSSSEILDLDEIAASIQGQPKLQLSKQFLEEFVQRTSNNQHLISNISWPNVLSKTREIDPHVNEVNFSGILFSVCSKLKNETIPKEYLKWDNNPSLSALTQYIKILAESETEVDESEILKLYDTIKLKNKNIWDFHSGQRVIAGISATSKWKESLDIIKSMYEGGGDVPLQCYLSLAKGAFKRKEYELGWSYLNKVGYTKCDVDIPLVEYLKNIEQPTEANITKVLEFMDVYEHFPTEHLVKTLRNIFKSSINYSVLDTRISENGTCTNCYTKLIKTKLSLLEYQKLSDSVLTKVLHDEDVFLNTTPSELKSYKDFINTSKPFDYVLDGLNIAFSRGRSNNADVAKVLENVVLRLAKQNQRVLVLGRYHMKKWPQHTIKVIQKASTLRLINNNSNDDAFILYAALKSGPTTKFVSKDMMRNHTFRLQDPTIAKIFKRWKYSNQLLVEHIGNRPCLVPFTKTLPVSQKDPTNGHWHIPYDTCRLYSPYDLPSLWLCLKPNSSK